METRRLDVLIIHTNSSWVDPDPSPGSVTYHPGGLGQVPWPAVSSNFSVKKRVRLLSPGHHEYLQWVIGVLILEMFQGLRYCSGVVCQFGSTFSWHTRPGDLCCFTGSMASCTKGKHSLHEIVCAWSPVPKETQEVKWNSLASRLGSVLPSEITLKPGDV